MNVAAQVLRAQPMDLDHDDERIFIKHHPQSSVSFAAISVGYAYPNGNAIGGPLIGVGRYIAQGLTNLDKETGQGLPALDWTYGAHGVIVEVDPDTGEYKVIKVASAFDVGRVINPDIVRGQAIGGMIQGLGTATCEGYIYDEAGHLLNPSFTDNKIPTAKDLPEEIESIAVEVAQLDGPFGARGVGEHPMISVAPALGNAIQQAVGALLLHMPIRFEDVWRALRKKEPIDNWITKTPTGSCRSDAAARLQFAGPRGGALTPKGSGRWSTQRAATACVLATGASRRMGRCKLSLPFGTGTLIETTVGNARSAGLRVIVVTRKEDERPSALLGAEVTVVRNSDPERGMTSSLREGARRVTAERFFFIPADMPFVGGDVYLMLAAINSAGPVIPTADGRRGHPVLMPSTLIPAIMDLTDDVPLKELISASGPMFVDVADTSILRASTRRRV